MVQFFIPILGAPETMFKKTLTFYNSLLLHNLRTVPTLVQCPKCSVESGSTRNWSALFHRVLHRLEEKLRNPWHGPVLYWTVGGVPPPGGLLLFSTTYGFR